MNMITRRLKDLGIEKKQKSNGKRYYIGIKINKEEIILDGRINLDKILVGVDKPTPPKKILDTFGEEIKF